MLHGKELVMNPFLPILAAAVVAITSATPDPMMPAYTDSPRKWRTIEEVGNDCSQRIDQVRADAGQPELERVPATSDRPMMIAAVDKRIDGCPVLQMAGNVNDLRPVPKRQTNKPLLQPVD